MVSLYEYDNATREECLDDLRAIIEWLSSSFYEDLEYDALEAKGKRLQYIAQRLSQLEEE